MLIAPTATGRAILCDARLRAYRCAFATMGGVILILSGLDMLNAYFFWVPTLAG
jgi:hypothetical protein